VKKGWQAEQTSSLISSSVDFVSHAAPQAQVTFVSLYSGCMLCFIVFPFCDLSRTAVFVRYPVRQFTAAADAIPSFTKNNQAAVILYGRNPLDASGYLWYYFPFMNIFK
jgi:hypothetical protein